MWSMKTGREVLKMRNPQLKKKAEDNHFYRKRMHEKEIEYSYRNSVVYDRDSNESFDIGDPRYDKTKINFIATDIRTYLENYVEDLDGKTAVLDFASYNNPGGKYMEGMLAQEAICHCTTLYEVLIKHQEYFFYNNNHKNRGLYKDRMVYVPKVLVFDYLDNVISQTDVIVCAAPNASVGLRYGNFTDEECQRVMYNRIVFLMHMAAYNKVDNLILGAWGCGVFRNDPTFVANAFYGVQALYDGYFRNIVYVMPKDANYDTFIRVGANGA